MSNLNTYLHLFLLLIGNWETQSMIVSNERLRIKGKRETSEKDVRSVGVPRNDKATLFTLLFLLKGLRDCYLVSINMHCMAIFLQFYSHKQVSVIQTLKFGGIFFLGGDEALTSKNKVID